LWNLQREFRPQMQTHVREKMLLGWRQAVARALL
jgi:ribosome modulation factor